MKCHTRGSYSRINKILFHLELVYQQHNFILFLSISSSRFNPDHELSDICTELWKLDDNRLTPGRDYQIDLQRRMW